MEQKTCTDPYGVGLVVKNYGRIAEKRACGCKLTAVESDFEADVARHLLECDSCTEAKDELDRQLQESFQKAFGWMRVLNIRF